MHGAATLIMTIVLVTLTTLIILFAASSAIMQDQIMSNTNRANQAFTAADAGMEYGINYLKQNRVAILATATLGILGSFINTSTTNVTMANGSKYTIVYTNPVAFNYNLINIASTGVSDDGKATRTVNQLVQFGSMAVDTPTVPLVSKGDTTLSGSTELVNNFGNTTLISGGSVTMSGSSKTKLLLGTSSTPGNIKSDIQQNTSSIGNQSNDDMFASYFGVSQTTVKSNVQHYYSNSSDTNYSSTLNGMTGTSIWIDQTNNSQATFTSSVTIGSPTNPVLLIINGNVRLAGSVTVYGLVYVIGTAVTDITGSVDVIGGIITTGTATLTGSTSVTYDPNVLSNMQTQSSMLYFAKVPGSWRDF